nr:sigma-70 family RNA polymerase sigma factor [Longitalea luteola]
MVFDHYYPGLMLFVAKLTGSREEAEDISLRTFQSLYSRCAAFHSEINIKAFLYISARNASLNYLKSRQRDKQQLHRFAARMEDDTFLEYEFAIRPPVIAALHKAIEELPGECRRIFKLIYFEERTPLEIADMLHISVSTIYNQKMRALNILRLKLSGRTKAIIWLLLSLTFMKVYLFVVAECCTENLLKNLVTKFLEIQILLLF